MSKWMNSSLVNEWMNELMHENEWMSENELMNNEGMN